MMAGGVLPASPHLSVGKGYGKVALFASSLHCSWEELLSECVHSLLPGFRAVVQSEPLAYPSQQLCIVLLRKQVPRSGGPHGFT